MDHPVPTSALEADICTLGQKGSGKSFTNRGLVERLLADNRRVHVLDPLSSWWGLKAKADGSPGFPIIVVGGPNADVPLDPMRGEELGEFLGRSSMSVVLDVSDLRRSELIRFATDYMTAVYRVNRDPLWVVLEEADVFAPQTPATDGSRAMHDAADQIARRGRARGFRLWTITQRPARLSKDVLTQASTLCLLRLRSPQDRAAAEEWIKGHAEKGQAAEISASLASLDVGEGYVWAPDLDLLKRVRFPRITTLDTSATPKAGEKRPQNVTLAKPDVGALAALLTKPKEADAPAKGRFVALPLDVESIKAEADRVGYARGRDDGEREGRAAAYARARRVFESAMQALEREADAPPVESADPIRRALPERAKVPSPSRASGKITGPQQLLLDTLLWTEAMLRADSVEKTVLALLAGVSSTSSAYANNLGALRTAGLVAYPAGGRVALTPEGRPLAVPSAKAKTNAAIQDAVMARLSGSQREVLNVLIRSYPAEESKEMVALKAGASPTSSAFANNLGRLRSLGLVDYPAPGKVVALPVLFPLPA